MLFSKTTKVTRKFNADGKVIEETVETTSGDSPASGKAAEEASKVADETHKEVESMFKGMHEFFDTMHGAFNKLWKRK